MKSSEFFLILGAILLAPHLPVTFCIALGAFYLVVGAGITFLEFMVKREEKGVK